MNKETKHYPKPTILQAYLSKSTPHMIFITICLGVFTFIFYLYRIELDAIRYSLLICGFVAVCFITIDFYHYYAKSLALSKIREPFIGTFISMPPPSDLIETQYQQLLNLFIERTTQQQTQQFTSYDQMIEDYTLWVHQVKTPIAVMHMLLHDEHTSTNQVLILELFKIEQYVDMAISLLRLTEIAQDLILAPTPLSKVIDDITQKYALLFTYKHNKLVVNDIRCDVLTDEKWLALVLDQILTNALKYTEAGTISIYMDPHQERTLIIEDTGIGIEPEDLPRIFDRGFTGTTGRKDKKATGLGLFLCSRILTKLHHSIHITSEPAKGTKVYLAFTRNSLLQD